MSALQAVTSYKFIPQNLLHTRIPRRKFLLKIRTIPEIVFRKAGRWKKKLTRYTTLEKLISQRNEIQK